MTGRARLLTSPATSPRPPITRDGARADARHELAKPIYHRGGDPLIVRALRAIGRFTDRLLNHAGGGGGLGWLSIAIVVTILAFAAFFVVRRVGVPVRAAGVGGLLIDGRTTTAAEHRARSEQAADDGDWQQAVLEHMRAVARELEERGVLDPRPGRTATELAREAGRDLPDAAAALLAAAETFNAVTYGGRPATAQSLATVREADDAVRRGARVAALT